MLLAFRREQQSEVDSWIPWLHDQPQSDQSLAFYEVPVLGRRWSPLRSFIDGGMAAAIRTPDVLRRTFTVDGNVHTLTSALGIVNQSSIVVLAVTNRGDVIWNERGGWSPPRADSLKVALAAR